VPLYSILYDQQHNCLKNNHLSQFANINSLRIFVPSM